MLKTIFGKSGSGKTELLYDCIKNDMKSGKRAYLIVPEQQSVIAERQIVSLCGNSCNMYLEVLNFSRLANRVFREYGGMSQKYIDDSGKMLILTSVLEEIAPNLVQYPNVINSDFISRLSYQLERMDISEATPLLNDDFFSENNFDDILRGKLSDLSLIYAAYKVRLRENYADPADDLKRLCDTLDEFSFFGNSNVYLDGFFEYSIAEYEVIKRILNQAEDVYVSLTLPVDVREESFNVCRKTARKLKALCENVEEKMLKEDLRTQTAGLKYLKDNLFDDFALPCEMCNGVSITECKNIYDECAAAARNIISIVKEENIRFSDFAVALRNTESYRGVIDIVFDKYEIPYFISTREDITLRPLLAFVFSALDCVTNSFRLYSVQRYIKSGLCGIESHEAFLLENYMLTWNISGKGVWEKEWIMNPDGYSANFGENQKEILKNINAIRSKLIKPLIELSESMKRQTVRERCAALYTFLARGEILEKITEQSEKYRAEGDYSSANEIITVWNILMNCLDQFVLIMGENKISAVKFLDTLKLLCENCSVAKIPSALDQVQIGVAGHMRSDKVKHVFILGLCENEFPALQNENSLLSDAERSKLTAAGIEFEDTYEDELSKEMFLFYLEASKPSHGLHLFTKLSDMTGEELTRSSFLYRVKDLIPNILEEKYYENKMPVCKNEAFDYLISHPEKGLSRLREYFLSDKKYSLKLRYSDNAEKILKAVPELDSKFFEGKNIILSQSSFEKYINCHYSYFLTNLLKVKPQKKAKFDYSVVGICIHRILEGFMRRMREDNIDFETLTDEKIADLSNFVVKEYINEYIINIDEKTPRFRYLFMRISKNALIVIRNLVEEMKETKFVPILFEEKLGDGKIESYEINLDDGSKIIFNGIVDRVDVYKSESGKTYVRVIDYKTGTSLGKFDLGDVINGFKVQMLIYLFASWQNGIVIDNKKGEVLPAGILYVPAVRPRLKSKVVSGREEYKKAIESEMKRTGLCLNDDKIIHAMEKEPGTRFLPIKYKDGEITTKEFVATLEQFGSLSRCMEGLFKKNADLIKKGSIEINPFCVGKNSCEYCDNMPICRFYGNGRKYEKINEAEEAWKEIERRT